jgi:AraC-like DNA-binding protein
MTLLLAPDAKLSRAVLSGIDAQMARLSPVIRDKVRDLLLTGESAHSLDTLAAMMALTRRALERRLADAGFMSRTQLLDAGRIVAGYRAITKSHMSLDSIARMLGHSMLAMDAQLVSMLGVSSRRLRAEPMSVDEVAGRIVRRLTERER